MVSRFLEELVKWEECNQVSKDRLHFNQHSQFQSTRQDEGTQTATTVDRPQIRPLFSAVRVLSETRLDEIHRAFDEMLRTGDYTSQIGERLVDLVRVQIHVDNVLPLGPDPQQHHLEYVMQKRRYHLCRLQMNELRAFMEKEFLSGPITRFMYDSWWPAIDYIRLRLGQLIVALKQWFKERPKKFQISVREIYSNAPDYIEDRVLYLASQNHHSEKQHHSGHSALNHVTFSPEIPSNAWRAGANLVVMYEEPEQMQSDPQGSQSEKRRRRPRRRGEDSIESSMSSVSLEDRPPTKQKGKDKGKDKATGP